jgi:hypothetical protein
MRYPQIGMSHRTKLRVSLRPRHPPSTIHHRSFFVVASHGQQPRHADASAPGRLACAPRRDSRGHPTWARPTGSRNGHKSEWAPKVERNGIRALRPDHTFSNSSLGIRSDHRRANALPSSSMPRRRFSTMPCWRNVDTSTVPSGTKRSKRLASVPPVKRRRWVLLQPPAPVPLPMPVLAPAPMRVPPPVRPA